MFCSYFQGYLTTSEIFSRFLTKCLLLLSKQHILQLIVDYVTEFVICYAQRCSWWSFLTAAVAVGSFLLSSTCSSDLILFRSPHFLFDFFVVALFIFVSFYIKPFVYFHILFCSGLKIPQSTIKVIIIIIVVNKDCPCYIIDRSALIRSISSKMCFCRPSLLNNQYLTTSLIVWITQM